MRLYLAGLEAFAGNKNNNYKLYLNNDTKVLTSFYYCNDIIIQDLIRQVGVDNILVDSGAFTFRMHGLKGEDIDSYTKKYIEFINKYNIKYFFEMDIDMCKEDLGKVKQLRGLIEKDTGKKTIPVWHMTRGINEWKELIDRYDYIAIGDIAEQLDKQFTRTLKQMIRYANRKGVKVHGLGYNRKDLLDYDFYSCDATSWQGGKYGNIWYWDKSINRPRHTKSDTANRRLRADKQGEVARHNYKVWYHYQKYLLDKGFWHE